MNEVVSSVKRVTDIIGEIADASAEQTTGIDQVNHAIAAMDQSTQQNAALVQQSAAAADSMREQAGNLVTMVGSFAGAPRTPALAPRKARDSATGTARPKVAARLQPRPVPPTPPTPPTARVAPVPRSARAGARHAPAPDTSWEEF
jgi:uncharacterized phage infection (PIP) family protein YhgE